MKKLRVSSSRVTQPCAVTSAGFLLNEIISSETIGIGLSCWETSQTCTRSVKTQARLSKIAHHFESIFRYLSAWHVDVGPECDGLKSSDETADEEMCAESSEEVRSPWQRCHTARLL